MNHRRRLLTITGILEAATGLILISLPAFPIELLLGIVIAAPAALVIARLAGLALLVIGIVCYLARHDQTSSASRGVVMGILIYNIGVAALLAYAGFALKLAGLLLWPVVVLHTALAVWCVGCLKSHSARGSSSRGTITPRE